MQSPGLCTEALHKALHKALHRALHRGSFPRNYAQPPPGGAPKGFGQGLCTGASHRALHRALHSDRIKVGKELKVI